MPLLMCSRTLEDHEVAEEVADRLQGRKPMLEREMAIQLAAEMYKSGHIKFEYAKDLSRARTIVRASVVVGQEQVVTLKQEEPTWHP